jgi:hypothetical protein
MPLPLILAGLAIGATTVGAVAKKDANEKNAEAKRTAEEAQNLYDSSKRDLEAAQEKTKNSLLRLGNNKKRVLDTSVHQFLTAYERIKDIELSESAGLDEIKKFTINQQDALQLGEMADIYQNAFASSAAGAATGAAIALAASGSLPIVTGTLSLAGSALAAGDVGIAVGLAGSALSFGAAMTPLAAIVAPAVLVSGLSAGVKAEENREQAEYMLKKATRESEEMKTKKVLYTAIADKADMFDQLLLKLDGLFSHCTERLDGVTKMKIDVLKTETVDARTFTEDELKLVAVTRSLAGAVKAVIDTPILTNEGKISTESEAVYEDAKKMLPAFDEAVYGV